MQILGVLGGTFDPVHHGHLRLAIEMLEQLELTAVRLIPAATPNLRDSPGASAELRLRMLDAAVRGVDRLTVDDRELRRGGMSYTADTLRELRRDLPDCALCLILGTDAFAKLDRWHRWTEIPKLAHLCVARRPGTSLPEEGPVAELLSERAVGDPARLASEPAGYVCVQETPRLEISASRIRALVSHGQSPRFLLPDAVLSIIDESNLYRG